MFSCFGCVSPWKRRRNEVSEESWLKSDNDAMSSMMTWKCDKSRETNDDTVQREEDTRDTERTCKFETQETHDKSRRSHIIIMTIQVLASLINMNRVMFPSIIPDVVNMVSLYFPNSSLTSVLLLNRQLIIIITWYFAVHHRHHTTNHVSIEPFFVSGHHDRNEDMKCTSSRMTLLLFTHE